MYYIISLCHTLRHEKHITLWRPKNAGYCYSKEMAGIYENPEKGYHDSETNMPITIVEAEKLFVQDIYDGVEKNTIPNNRETWKKLGVSMRKDGLVKLKN